MMHIMDSYFTNMKKQMGIVDTDVILDEDEPHPASHFAQHRKQPPYMYKRQRNVKLQNLMSAFDLASFSKLGTEFKAHDLSNLVTSQSKLYSQKSLYVGKSVNSSVVIP